MTERDDGVIAVRWHSPDDVPTPLFSNFLPAGTERVESWTEVDWSAPGVMALKVGAVPVGMSTETADKLFNVHIMTPESETGTHYFYASTGNFAVEDGALNDMIRDIRARIFATEDEPMIAALLRIDAAAVKVRRRMEALIAREGKAVP